MFVVFSGILQAVAQTEPKTIALGELNAKARLLVFPTINFKPRMAGSVTVEVVIDLQNGEVVSATAVDGHPLLRGASAEAARQTKFAPLSPDLGRLLGNGTLVYKVTDLFRKSIENKKASSPLSFADSRKAIFNGRGESLKKPNYPDAARETCVGGKVEVLMLFNNWTGEIFAARAVTGSPLLFEAAESAVMKSKMTPSRFDGENDFFILGTIVYNFDGYAKRCGPKPRTTKTQ